MQEKDVWGSEFIRVSREERVLEYAKKHKQYLAFHAKGWNTKDLEPFQGSFNDYIAFINTPHVIAVTNLEKIKLGGQELQWADLSKLEMSNAKLQCAKLQNANLQGTKLHAANLRKADLQDANLSGAEMPDAKLQRANLRGANLRGADLRGADFQNADLRGAILDGANLDRADFRGAIFSDADVKVEGVPPQKAKRQKIRLRRGKQPENTQNPEPKTINTQWKELQTAMQQQGIEASPPGREQTPFPIKVWSFYPLSQDKTALPVTGEKRCRQQSWKEQVMQKAPTKRQKGRE